jgi:two-component sensor histidine kinase
VLPNRRERRLSTRSFLYSLVAAVVVPLLVFAAFLLYRFAAAEQRRFENEAAQIARHVGLVIDGELAAIQSLLEGLASSSSLADGDFARFYSEAKRLVRDRDMIVVLREPGPRQILNTQRPFETALPPAPPISPVQLASLQAGQSVIGDVYPSPLSGEARVPVAIPIRPDGRLAYVLAITVPTTRVRDALMPAVPPGWLIGVGDRQGTIVTRSARHEDVTGKPGLPEYLEKAVGRSGTFKSTSFDGTTIVAGYHRSDLSGWLYAANISEAVVGSPLRRSLLALGLLGLAALTLSAALAYRFSAGLTAATTGLARGALALGEGRSIPDVPTNLTEFSIVAEALAAAGVAIDKRTRELETVLATVPAAVWFTYDPEVKRVVRNRFAAEFMRLPPGETAAFHAAGSPESRARMLRGGVSVPDEQNPLRRAMRGERLEDEEYTIVFPDGTNRTLLTSATALQDERGTVLGAVLVGLDITERKQGEDQRRLLLHELNHRVKNTLATVQSIAFQTLRGATSVEQARDALADRLVALAKAHDTLTRESWEGAELHDIVAGAIAPHAGSARFSVECPPVWLTPTLSLSLALALHELATNAAKYGALSTATGRVRISWDIGGPLKAERLRLEWREQGGPPVSPRSHMGFGTRLIERSFSADLEGSATIDFQPDGVRCVIEAPLLEGGSRTAAAIA